MRSVRSSVGQVDAVGHGNGQVCIHVPGLGELKADKADTLAKDIWGALRLGHEQLVPEARELELRAKALAEAEQARIEQPVTEGPF